MTINQEQVWRELKTLPDEAQRQILDYIAFLRWQYAQPVMEKKPSVSNLRDEPFIGMWRDREDMQNSRQWVRNLRANEWR